MYFIVSYCFALFLKSVVMETKKFETFMILCYSPVNMYIWPRWLVAFQADVQIDDTTDYFTKSLFRMCLTFQFSIYSTQNNSGSFR